MRLSRQLVLTLVLSCLPLSGITTAASGQDTQERPFQSQVKTSPGLILYVAPNGNDAHSGTLPNPNNAKTDGPFATLTRARDAIRALKNQGPLPQGGVAVHLRAGAYELPATFQLSEQDSGTRQAPIVYCAHPGEKVILTGGRQVTGFTPHEGNVLKADLAAQGLKDISGMQVLFNGKRQILARYPNFDPENPYGGGYAYVEGTPINMYKPWPGGENVRTIQCKPKDVRRWADPTLGEVIIFPRYNWNNVCIPIGSADPDKGTITLAKDLADPNHPQSRSIRPMDRYFVRGLPEELDSPGEWFLDRKTWTLYFQPPGPMENATVHITTLQNIIKLYHTSWITIRGFDIQGCDAAAIPLIACHHCLIVGNTIHDTGGKLGYSSAIEAFSGKNCGVVGNDIYEICNNGIRLNGSRSDFDTLEPTGHYAENNYIHHIGILNGHGCGIMLSGVGIRISHNLIHDTTRTGIFGGGPDCIVEYNHMRHTNLQTEDTGAYYNSGVWHVRGQVIRYNLIHDVLGYGRKGKTWSSPHHSWGIYLDDDHSGSHVYGNIVARTTVGGSHVHAGRDNLIENNIFVDQSKSQMMYSGHRKNDFRAQSKLPKFKEAMQNPAYQKRYPELVDADPEEIWKMAGNTFRRNIIYYTKPDAFLFQMRTHDGNVFKENESDYNLIWHAGLPLKINKLEPDNKWHKLTWQQWQEKGFDQHSIVADPLFVDPSKDDYRLKPDSPAFKLGFKPIPIDDIGPYASPLRASWPIIEADGVREKPLVNITVELPAPSK